MPSSLTTWLQSVNDLAEKNKQKDQKSKLPNYFLLHNIGFFEKVNPIPWEGILIQCLDGTID